MLPSSDCVVSEEVCCTTLYDVADHILQGVYAALLECAQPSPCNGGGWLAYVTMGDGDDLVLDALSVAIESVTPSFNSQRDNRLGPVSMMNVGFTVRIVESGWPMAYEDNGQIFQPDPVEQNALARHAYAHGERMYRKLTYMASSGGIVPAGMACSHALVSPLMPLNPMGGTVGWKAIVTLTLPWGK